MDNARICRHNGRFYLFYIGFDGQGYRTALAVSDDLLYWEEKGVVLDAGSGRPWDTNGRAISCLLADTGLYGTRELIKRDGKYWMYYHAYPGAGYETGAAANGLAWCSDENLLEWHCEEQPVFSKGPEGSWDGAGLYSVWFVPGEEHNYLFYNGKERPDFPWHEQVGVAFSDSMHNWTRHADNPVLRVTENHWDSIFSCGQHVLRDSRENRWVMFYCGFDGRHAQDGVAVSDDLLHWEKCAYPVLPHGPAGSLDALHAHKPCIIQLDGVLYHIYCAVRPTETDEERAKFGHEFRCLSIACSRPFAE